ncbi:hypothetical protein C5167_010652, partial [Papaver somniferum]
SYERKKEAFEEFKYSSKVGKISSKEEALVTIKKQEKNQIAKTSRNWSYNAEDSNKNEAKATTTAAAVSIKNEEMQGIRDHYKSMLSYRRLLRRHVIDDHEHDLFSSSKRRVPNTADPLHNR